MNIINFFVRIMKFWASIIFIGIFLFRIVDTNGTSFESRTCALSENQPNQLCGNYNIFRESNPIIHKVPPSTSSSVVYVKKKYCSKVLCIIQNQSWNRLCHELCPTICQKYVCACIDRGKTFMICDVLYCVDGEHYF